MSTQTANPAFLPLMTLAVIADLREVRVMTSDQLRKAAAEAVDPLASDCGSIIRNERIRNPETRAERRAGWKALVRGVAIAAMQPGGTVLFGQHFDATQWPFAGGES